MTEQTHVEALFFEGNALMAQGKADAAEACFVRALALEPDAGAVLANLAWLKDQAGLGDEAERFYRRALAVLPENLQIHFNLGLLLKKQKRFEAAELLLRRAVQLAPEAPAGWSNLGVLLACMQRDAEAEQCYRRALELDPDHAKASFNLSYVLLRQGRFAEGWQRLEARDDFARLASHFACARWAGQPLAGKSIVIGFEAGQGDMIQFCRYSAVLAQLGAARITLVCHPGLTQLLRSLPSVDRVYGFDEDVPSGAWDYWTVPLSLPHLCGTDAATIPAKLPYLSAEPARMARWAARLPQGRLRVGLAWKGNPNFENDAERSLPSLDTLAPLGALAGIDWISLQKGAGEADALTPPPGLDLLALGSELHDFADTAAVIAQLDLVISVDTAVAHLTGALGKPCWLLLPGYRADWRWLTGRTDSPWYPGTLRLFRQARGGNWDQPVDALKLALTQWQRARAVA